MGGLPRRWPGHCYLCHISEHLLVSQPIRWRQLFDWGRVSCLQISNVLVHYDYLVCPVEYSLRKDALLSDSCVRNPVFLPHEYTLPKTIQSLSSLVRCTTPLQSAFVMSSLINAKLLQVGSPMTSVSMYPITFHVIFLALFAALIGPFGGFFASGFKRAFKIKVR